MNDPRTWIIAVLAIAVAFFALDGKAAEPDPNAELKTEDLIRTLEERGHFVFATDPTVGVDDLVAQIESLEGDTARLAVQLRDAVQAIRVRDGEIRGVVTANLDLHAALDQLQGVVDSVTAEGDPVSVSAAIDDPAFSGWLRYFYESRTFDAELRASPRFALTISEAPDGRFLFSAIAEDERFTPIIENGAWDPPPPIYQCTVRQQLRAGAVGGGIVGVVAAIAALAGG